MNRQIKFRIWSVREQKWLTEQQIWVYRDERQTLNQLFEKQNYDVKYQQFTGIKDKHGREIYEGDILKFKTYDGWKDSFGRYVFLEVRYHELTASFRMTRGETYRGDSFDYSDKPKEVEVVGNIFENPELLIAPAIELEVHSVYRDGDGSIYCYDKEGKDVEYPSIWPDKIEDLVKFMDKKGVRIVK